MPKAPCRSDELLYVMINTLGGIDIGNIDPDLIERYMAGDLNMGNATVNTTGAAGTVVEVPVQQMVVQMLEQ